MKKAFQKMVLSIEFLSPYRKKQSWLMIFTALAGYLLGTIASGTASKVMPGDSSRLWASLHILCGSGFFSVLWRSLCVDGVYCAFCILCALFPFGVMLIWASLFLRGMSCGMLAGIICVGHGLKGFAFQLFGVLPGTLISVFAFLCVTAHCFISADVRLYAFMHHRKPPLMKKPQPGELLFLVLLFLIAALLKALFFTALSGLTA